MSGGAMNISSSRFRGLKMKCATCPSMPVYRMSCRPGARRKRARALRRRKAACSRLPGVACGTPAAGRACGAGWDCRRSRGGRCGLRQRSVCGRIRGPFRGQDLRSAQVPVKAPSLRIAHQPLRRPEHRPLCRPSLAPSPVRLAGRPAVAPRRWPALMCMSKNTSSKPILKARGGQKPARQKCELSESS